VFVKVGDEAFVIAEQLVEAVAKACGFSSGTILHRAKGTDLHQLLCRRPLSKGLSPVLLADFVTLDQGTGCVHIAPGHGQEDYELSLRNSSLKVLAPVDNRGRFTEEVPEFQSLKVFEANPKITENLKERGLLLGETKLTHSYPHCWRCKNPVIFRATDQWFVSMEKNGLRTKALKEIERVKWIPSWGRDRIHGMIENRPDWCLSRQRVWFHSALLAGVTTDGRAPYDSVLTHGFVVDGEGKKMSKSAGNVVAPQEVMKQYGADILRLWVSAQDYTEDLRLSPTILTRLSDAYRKIRNTT